MFSIFINTYYEQYGWLTEYRQKPCIKFMKNKRSACTLHLAYVRTYILDALSLTVKNCIVTLLKIIG